MKTLAILSPGQNNNLETFVHAHKNLPFAIKFYYGGPMPSSLESGDILDVSFLRKVQKRLLRNFSPQEKMLMFSLLEEKVDCVLAEYGTMAADTLKVVRKLKLPLIVHFHGYDASIRNVINQYREKYHEMFTYASNVIVVSKKMYDTLLELGCPQEKLVLNCYGPNDSFFDVSPAYEKAQFISVGRFVNKKAPYLTIFSFKRLTEKCPYAKLVMVGEGELLDICKSLTHLLQLENHIEFKGNCDREEIRRLFQESIAFVQHSIVARDGDSEGTPVAILEAQAAGLPVIATIHAGIPDVVKHNETGLLVEEHDVVGMSKNMIRILEEEGLAKSLGENGKKRVKDLFPMEKHLGTLEHLIDRL